MFPILFFFANHPSFSKFEKKKYTQNYRSFDEREEERKKKELRQTRKILKNFQISSKNKQFSKRNSENFQISSKNKQFSKKNSENFQGFY